jgi:hypothetical protein
MLRGRRCVPPSPGNIPTLISGVAKRALPPATTMSARSARQVGGLHFPEVGAGRKGPLIVGEDDGAHFVVPPGLVERRTQLAQQRLLGALRRSSLLSCNNTTWSAGCSTISSFVMLPALLRPGPDGE